MSNALERGLDVLEILAKSGEARVTDIMAQLGVSRATVFRIISTLETRGYVEHVKHKPLLRLGRVVGQLADAVDTSELARLAAPALSDLHQKTGETVNLAILQRHRIIWAAAVESDFTLRHSTTIGDAVPAYATAIGKALLASLPRSTWNALLPSEPFPARTPNTRRTLAELEVDVESARARGWALDDEESELSGVCVAASILGSDGRAIAAISVSSVTGRLVEKDRAELGAAVREWCARITTEFSAEPASRV